MFLVKLAFKNLTRHRKRTLITAAVIALAVVIYLMTDSLLIGMVDKSFENVIDFESGHIQIVNQNYWEEREDLPLKNLIRPDRELLTFLQKVDGLKGLTPVLTFSATLNNGIEEIPVVAQGIDPQSYSQVLRAGEYLVEGEFLTGNKSTAVMGKTLAKLMDLKTGDYITLVIKSKEGTFNTIDVQISGLVDSPNPSINENIVFVPLEIARQALNVRGMVSQIIIRVEDRIRAVETARLLSDDLQEAGSSLRAFSWRKSAEYIVALNKAERVETQMILGIILLIAAIGIINFVVLAALERMEEIGMMKALGLKQWEIVIVFVMEAVGVSLIGGIIGCLVGGAVVAYLVFYGVDIFSLGGEDAISSMGIPVLGRIYGGFNPGSFIFVFSYSVIVSLLVSIFPARWAARKDPVKAIYHR
ncbi:ABC-type transport system, involved in lipoprotein release, permease component [Halothermothrix orenii H 168]|uniref:ABC-type transport system, involved in lipoprotein release, permease component n=2 Tax=Halothermothrix orenii TaxID=31909 RepID=B8D1B7_HALOH|nr:ABC-type transport system, involved in lipoprotein release, permease component [Halothermothrix orenii H 168]